MIPVVTDKEKFDEIVRYEADVFIRRLADGDYRKDRLSNFAESYRERVLANGVTKARRDTEAVKKFVDGPEFDKIMKLRLH